MLSSSKRSQIGSIVSVGTTEDSKEGAGTLEDQEVEEKLPKQIQSLKEVGGCFLCLKAGKEVQQKFFHSAAVLMAMD